jgi:hypothetical protein
MVISRKLGLPDLTFVEMDHVSIDSQSKIFGFNSGKPVPMSLRAARNEPIVLALEREILPDSDNHTVHMSSHFEKYVRNDGRRCDAMKLVFLKDDEQAHLYRTILFCIRLFHSLGMDQLFQIVVVWNKKGSLHAR